jgi:hypothetical protein
MFPRALCNNTPSVEKQNQSMINVYQHVNECKLLIKSQSIIFISKLFSRGPRKGAKDCG